MPENGATRCTACGSEASRFVLTKKAQTGTNKDTVTLRRCLRCGTTFLEDWPAWYAREAYDYYRERIGRPREELYDPITEKRYQALLHRLGPSLPGKRILDIGCGQGHFVDAAARAGYAAQGIETSAPAVDICTSYGLDVRRLDLFAAELRPSSYDLCTLFEVIEHVPAPADLLRRAEELIAPGGYLYLTTPNFGSLERRLMKDLWHPIHAEHLTYFDPRTLASLIGRSTSLEVVESASRNISLTALRIYARNIAGGSARAADIAGTSTGSASSGDKHLRETIETSRILQWTKAAANAALSATGLGSAMSVLCRKL